MSYLKKINIITVATGYYFLMNLLLLINDFVAVGFCGNCLYYFNELFILS